MRLELVKSTRTRIRLPVATFTALCGVATAAGSLLTWVSARGARPRMGDGPHVVPADAGLFVREREPVLEIGRLCGARARRTDGDRRGGRPADADRACGAACARCRGDVDRADRAPLQHAEPAERALPQPGEPALVRPARGRLADDSRRCARVAERVLAAPADTRTRK